MARSRGFILLNCHAAAAGRAVPAQPREELGPEAQAWAHYKGAALLICAEHTPYSRLQTCHQQPELEGVPTSMQQLAFPSCTCQALRQPVPSPVAFACDFPLVESTFPSLV